MKKLNPKDIEAKLIRKFVKRDKQDRYLAFIDNPKSRQKFLNKLSHFSDFETANFEELRKDEKHIILDRIKSLGVVKDCYIISENSELDGRRMLIGDALTETIGYGHGTIIVFGDAEFVYYDGEDCRLLSIEK